MPFPTPDAVQETENWTQTILSIMRILRNVSFPGGNVP
jgi:hypothetical protein